jgi:hypothetical protein
MICCPLPASEWVNESIGEFTVTPALKGGAIENLRDAE